MTFLKMFKHLIYDTNQTMWTGAGSGLLISKLEKVIDVRMDGSVSEEKSSFKVLKSTFFSRLDWRSCIISIAKTASKKIGALIRSTKFLSPEDALHLHKSTIRPFMECCCHVWAGAPIC